MVILACQERTENKQCIAAKRGKQVNSQDQLLIKNILKYSHISTRIPNGVVENKDDDFASDAAH